MTADARAGRASPRRRLFFALRPDRPTATALARIAEALLGDGRGRPVPAHKLHLTVAFLGAVDAPARQRAEQVPPVPVGAFRLRLDHVGYFRRSGTLWLGPSAVPQALTSLERALWEGLRAAGFERERRAFRPHVTLARRSRGAPRGAVLEVAWDVDTLSLMESVPAGDGVEYRVLRRWPL
jgi:2'-5' RNA ligase